MNKNISGFISIIILIAILSVTVYSQTTEFTYQGRLLNASAPATGNYDFEFALYDAVSGGVQIGAALTRSSVAVTEGNFAVQLDFGNNFPGANRCLEIRVRQTGSGAYTLLTPRQRLLSAPYAVRSISAAAADTVIVTGIPSGSGNYIQNTTSLQPSSNFFVSGNGTAAGILGGNIVNTTTQFNIGGNRILSAPGTDNLFVGFGAGQANTAGGVSNVFFGNQAGLSNVNGSWNTFFGSNAGRVNSSGHSNAFFGRDAGYSNETGMFNAFFGNQAGYSNTASGNAFFGHYAGYANFTATNNAFFGAFAGQANTTGVENAFFGYQAGNANLTGGRNTLFGYQAGGLNTSSDNAFFGWRAGGANTTGFSNVFLGLNAGASNTTGNNNTIVGSNAGLTAGNLEYATAIGAGSTASSNNSIILGRSNGLDMVVINGLGSGGSTTLCRNASNQISTCSSSARYKSNVNPFSSGLSLIKQLRPVSFNWKDGGMADMGLVAEEVNKVEPLLTTTNDKGEVEGVKYDRVGVVLVNAIKEQQAQIEALERRNESQQKQIEQQNKEIGSQKLRLEEQQRQIDGLKKLICPTNQQAEICKEQLE